MTFVFCKHILVCMQLCVQAIHESCSWSTLTPYYAETILNSKKELQEINEDGVSTLYYLKTIYPDEWHWREGISKPDAFRAVWKSTSEFGYGDNVASMAWGARNLISTQVPRDRKCLEER